MIDKVEMIEEFKVEAAEMFQNAEEGLLNIYKGLDFDTNFNIVFRSFHSLKGGAGMFGLAALYNHMRKVESLFEAQKKHGGLKKNQIYYFLHAVDSAKVLMDGGSSDFIHIANDKFTTNAKIADCSPVISKAQVAISDKMDRKNGVIFIVDDESDILEILSAIIEVDDYVICKFENGKDALGAFEKFRPDVILSDVMMPVMGGIDLLREINEASPQTPVVFISGNLSKEKMQEALRFGAYAFIDKPFKGQEILDITRSAVKRSQSMQLLKKSINFITYQFHDLDRYLESQGKENVRHILKSELEILLEQRKILSNNGCLKI
jgi:DNA-binding response OmpR family regulator/HPt (histidine-containing phosphotransfer) domain-containing protein